MSALIALFGDQYRAGGHAAITAESPLREPFSINELACIGSPFTFPTVPPRAFRSPLPLIGCPPAHENDAVVMGMPVPALYRGARCGLPR